MSTMTTEIEGAMARLLEERENRERPVRGHPRFHDLVKAVAVVEQPYGPPKRWRESITYGSWWTRRASNRHGAFPAHWQAQQRAWKIARLISDDLGLLPQSPPDEGTAMAYVIARDNVRRRLR